MPDTFLATEERKIGVEMKQFKLHDSSSKTSLILIGFELYPTHQSCQTFVENK